jgi:hypothetical protein
LGGRGSAAAIMAIKDYNGGGFLSGDGKDHVDVALADDCVGYVELDENLACSLI